MCGGRELNMNFLSYIVIWHRLIFVGDYAPKFNPRRGADSVKVQNILADVKIKH